MLSGVTPAKITTCAAAGVTTAKSTMTPAAKRVTPAKSTTPDTTPGTPTKKITKEASASDVNATPTKSAAKAAAPPTPPVVTARPIKCVHENPAAFVVLDGSYFSHSFLSKKKHFPKFCSGAGCGLKFTNRQPVAGKEVKVTASKPVRACENGTLRDSNKCVYALCTNCFNKAMEKALEEEITAAAGASQGRRTRRSRRDRTAHSNVMCGEVKLPNGNICVAK